MLEILLWGHKDNPEINGFLPNMEMKYQAKVRGELS